MSRFQRDLIDDRLPNTQGEMLRHFAAGALLASLAVAGRRCVGRDRSNNPDLVHIALADVEPYTYQSAD